MTDVAFLYSITNKTNGMQYIGVTKNPKVRFRGHTVHNIKTRSALKNAVNKHGADNFEMNILCQGTQDYCYELEGKAIQSFNTRKPNGYNICSGGRGSVGILAEYNGMYGKKGELHHNYGKPGYRTGMLCTEETKKKMSESHKGRVFSEETRAKISAMQKAKWADPEYKQKMIDKGFCQGRRKRAS
jgi:group I intron endonuclease